MNILILIFSFLIGISIGAESISETNQKAINAFYQKEYSLAEKWFKESLKKNPNDPYANYNLACIYTILRSQCEELNDDQDVFSLLEKAVTFKKSYKSLMLKDKDLSLFHTTYRFNEIAGLNPKVLFSKIIWYGPSPGAYGPISEIKFETNGTFTLKIVSFRESDGALERPKYIGNFKWISDNTLQLEFQKVPSSFSDQTKTRRAIWEKDILKIDGFDYQFSDSPDRCSA